MTHQIPKYNYVRYVGDTLVEDVNYFRNGSYEFFKSGSLVSVMFPNMDDLKRFKGGYVLKAGEEVRYFSKRYNKWVVLPEKMWSDGATGAMDIPSLAWWIHDALCNEGRFECGSLCTNFMASPVLCSILRQEKRYFRAVYWWPVTWIGGGGQARENGMV